MWMEENNNIGHQGILKEEKDLNAKKKRNDLKIVEVSNKKNIKEQEKIKSYIKNSSEFQENFELGELVGAGAESLVFNTFLKKPRKKFIAKIILRKEGGKPNIEEINIAKKMKNKNIVESYGAITIKDNKLDCILLGEAKFGDLRNFSINILKRRVLNESLLCFICWQILSGLKYLHMNKIVHFDLKPQNIVVDEYLNIKIIDFSVSLHYGKIKSNQIKLKILGTNFYIAPELIKKRTIEIKDLNKIDLYSLGVIMYNLAFGNYPYNLKSEDSHNYDKIIEKIDKNNLEIIDNGNFYSPCFKDFLHKLLEKDIDKRINIDEAINHYWVKGSKILLDEKERIYNAGIFLGNLITGSFKSFNDYINYENKFFPFN